MDARPLILRARVVLPLRRPAVADGAVAVFRGRIAAVGRWRHVRAVCRGHALDLGEVVLLPGLVNAHCHLDYTHMVGHFPPPRSFIDFIKLITVEKAAWTEEDFLRSWRAGADMLLRSGATTVGDVEAVPELLPRAWNATPLRVLSFLEMTGIRSRRAPRLILREALARIAALRHPRCAATLSPHAPYSTVPELLRLTAGAARRRGWPVTIHLAESALEYQMFARGRGEMFDWLRRSGRDMSDCGGGSPVRHLARAGLLGRNLLAIHVNYLAPGDADLLARRGTMVVHCPRSHEYFRHRPFPRRALERAGVNVCLGTDSLATVRKFPRQHIELSLFEEMRCFAHHDPAVPPATILQMATRLGARALGRAGELGELRAGARADLITVPFTGALAEVCAALVHHRGPVAASMIGGQWVFGPHAADLAGGTGRADP